MNREVTTRAVVVGRYAAGEGSVRALLYTEALGLVGCIAKSAREERSKLRPHLVVGTKGTYSLVRGSYDWRVVGAVQTAHVYFSGAPKSVQTASASVITLVPQLVRGDGSESALFDALWHFLESLKTLPEEYVATAERLAVLRILFALGYVADGDVEVSDFCDYSLRALTLSPPEESRCIRAINEGLLASGLVH